MTELRQLYQAQLGVRGRTKVTRESKYGEPPAHLI